MYSENPKPPSPSLWKRLRWGDLFIALLSIGCVFFFGYKAYAGAESASAVRVTAGGDILLYPLHQDRIVTIAGPIGETRMEIRDQQVRVVQSPCSEKICVKMGWISKAGDWIACLPNRVMILIVGDQEQEAVDATVY